MLSDPKVVAAALAVGGKLARLEEIPGGRLGFVLTNLPAEFLTRIVNDEVQVSAKAFIAAMETVLGIIAQHQRGRR